MSQSQSAFESDFRAEVIAAYVAHAELLRWKLVLVAAIGGVGLGVTLTTQIKLAPLLLCIIPAVCVYVDLLYSHLTLRVHVLATFLRYYERADEGYRVFEDYVARLFDQSRIHPFALESWAVHGSTILLSSGVVASGALVRNGRATSMLQLPQHTWPIFVIAGGAGTLASIVLIAAMRHYVRRIRVAAAEIPVRSRREVPDDPNPS